MILLVVLANHVFDLRDLLSRQEMYNTVMILFVGRRCLIKLESGQGHIN